MNFLSDEIPDLVELISKLCRKAENIRSMRGGEYIPIQTVAFLTPFRCFLLIPSPTITNVPSNILYPIHSA